MNPLRQGNIIRISGLSAMLVCLLVAGAMADYVQDFETLNYGTTPAGAPLTGQDGYYIPSGTTSVDFNVYNYAANELGIPVNPTGGIVFIAGTGPGVGSAYARAQRDMTVTDAVWEFGYDFCAHYVANPGPAANNVGSFSGQPVSTGQWIHIFTWVPGFEGTNFTAGYMFYDAAGTQYPAPGEIPGSEWDMLELDTWYRATTTVDFVLNQCVEVTIQNLSSGGPVTTFVPTGWYLEGGSGGSTTPMTGFRWFAGGSACCNSVAYDNANFHLAGVTPVEPTTWGNIKASFK